jgi:hypothetical protein
LLGGGRTGAGDSVLRRHFVFSLSFYRERLCFRAGVVGVVLYFCRWSEGVIVSPGMLDSSSMRREVGGGCSIYSGLMRWMS